MIIETYIEKKMEEEGRSKLWLAGKLNMNKDTFYGKLRRKSFSADELVQIGIIMDLDLNELKKLFK